ncbi:CMGC/CDK protein kinase [Spizellomyces punctatus DAOM BR117]|uniref:Cyclin-dependent kinase 1 n=1 Tax=Spizellomyces punctatus (strain DAOM BR117) TaxID=645134 RepID=A0A0L0HLF8_SPIPD|nr:CMGC/CDK protein kinase [Spizellomyces punctatus DAOM BR117]KND01893.1 CMGC/CDK protein kinase [Spizellomyces punctatus DAOM BR117]|eukprot:XP_016609932.1 CMGC/CDK protein kinase [Spizellomyces punctatus DAOM BR117]
MLAKPTCGAGDKKAFWNLFCEREAVGSGVYGTVYRARYRSDGRIVAVKSCKLPPEKEFGFNADVVREITLLKSLHHPNIVRIEEVFQYIDNGQFKAFMVMELCSRSLRDMLETRQRGLDTEVTKVILRQILQGLEYCHARRVAHRDLKPENILLVDDLMGNISIKLADFGLSRIASCPTKAYSPNQVTALYRAPEVFYGSSEYSMPVDIWSVGCIFAEMVRGKRLFGGGATGDLAVIRDIQRKLGDPKQTDLTYDFDRDPVRISPFPEQPLSAYVCREEYAGPLDSIGVDLLSQMLLYDPRRRIRACQALEHQYFSAVNHQIHSHCTVDERQYLDTQLRGPAVGGDFDGAYR